MKFIASKIPSALSRNLKVTTASRTCRKINFVFVDNVLFTGRTEGVGLDDLQIHHFGRILFMGLGELLNTEVVERRTDFVNPGAEAAIGVKRVGGIISHDLERQALGGRLHMGKSAETQHADSDCQR
jgi:hypothetical protein